MNDNLVRIGIAGLGRLGKRHALNLSRLPGARLVAASSLVEEELAWARETLDVSVYKDYQEMLDKAGLDAVWIATPSTLHAEQSLAGLERGLHVFCEKPLGLGLEECLRVEAAAARSDRVFFPGFVRRFDPSYAYAKALVDQGAIGRPFLVRSQTADLDEYAAFQVAFVPGSGGIFLDMNVHDVDLARWFLGDEVESVYAVGGSYAHPEFTAINDADNTEALLKFRGGAMASLAVSRTAFHGHDTHTEVKGTKGILKIGLTPAKNRVEVFDAQGARRECVKDFYERFSEGFLAEAQGFVDCIRTRGRPPVSAADGRRATEVALALTESFRKGIVIRLEPRP